LPDCQLILLPRYGAPVDELARPAAWLLQQAPGRARIALTLHFWSKDETHKANVYTHRRAIRLAGRGDRRRRDARPLVQAAAGHDDGDPAQHPGREMRMETGAERGAAPAIARPPRQPVSARRVR
jgi:hypothetical protein